MSRRATVDDIHATALAMPHVTVARTGALPVYQVGGKSFVFFRTPRADGHPSVLLLASRVGEVLRDEVVELVQDAWLAQASRRRAETWLREHHLET